MCGAGAIFDRQTLSFFPLSTRRLRRSGDGVAGTKPILHRPLGRFHLLFRAGVIHRMAYPKAHLSLFRFFNSSNSRFRGLKAADFCGKTPAAVSVGVDSREFRGSVW
jgi:hypothetical protein